MLQSHTASQQWQSFEMRMRQRRVDRCLLRASVAIEAGVLDDAREALEEVRRLTPNEPALEPLVAQLAEAENPPPIEPMVAPPAPEITGGRRRFAAAAVLLMGSVVAGWWWSSSLPGPSSLSGPSSPAPSAAEQVTAPPAPPVPSVRVSEMSVAAPVSEEPVPAAEAPISTSGSPAADNSPTAPQLRTADVETREASANTDAKTRLAPRETVQDSRGSGVGEPRSAARPQPGETRDGRLAFADPASNATVRPSLNDVSVALASPAAAPPKIEPLGGLPEIADASPRVVTGPEGITAPDATPRAAAAVPVVPPAPPANPAPTGRADEQGVRATLGRYESAYNRLDAAAAASVWPGVNQRALASAFQGLSAQAISLGRCDVRLNGATAHAECSGNARWTPKVGGGTQGGARQWRFDLRNSGGDWLITQATAK